jgi:hypothetical protein
MNLCARAICSFPPLRRPPNRELRLTEIRRPEVSSRVRRPLKRERRRICDALPSRPDDLLSARGILSNFLGRALPEKSISAPLRFLVTIYDTVRAVRPQSDLSVIRLIPKWYSNLGLAFKGTPRKRVSDCHRTETDNRSRLLPVLPRKRLRAMFPAWGLYHRIQCLWNTASLTASAIRVLVSPCCQPRHGKSLVWF